MKKRQNMICFSAISVVLAVAGGLLIGVLAGQYRETFKDCSDFISVTYTYQSGEYVARYRNHHYEITVSEEENPLIVHNIYLKAFSEQNLLKLESGDVVRCYVERINNEKYSYSLAEMTKGDLVIMSLRDYNAAGRENAVAGLVISSVLCFVSLVFCVYYIVKCIRK